MGCSASAATTQSPIEAITYRNYKLGEKIGKGSYAQVHLAVSPASSEEVAVKIRLLQPEKAEVGKALKSSHNEVRMWKALRTHKNCVQLLDSFFDDHFAYMVMEKCACSLYEHLRSYQAVNEGLMAKAFQQMLTGISHMHSCGVVHRDIKPDNFLVGGKDGNTVKICDFGLSAKLPENGILRGVLGTAPYMSPEMLLTQQYDEKADVWAVGVVAYLLLCGEFPYQTADGSAKMMKTSIAKGAPAECYREWLSGNCIDFLQQMLARDPRKRPSASLARACSYFVDTKSDSLPSLTHILVRAKRTGAFGSESVSKTTEADSLLKELQQDALGNLFSKSFTDSNIITTISKIMVSSPSGEFVECTSDGSTAAGSSPHSSERPFSSKASSKA